MADEQRRGAINLLEQHDLCQRVRQGERRQAKQEMRAFFYVLRQAVGAADHESGLELEQRRELRRGEVLAAFIERDEPRAARNALRALYGDTLHLVAARHAREILDAGGFRPA